MSIKNNNNNVQYMKNNNKKLNFSELINNTLEDLENKTKTLKIKDKNIKENIRSIQLKEKKNSKITEEIINRKEELKLLKELIHFKEKKSMTSEDLISSYLSFLISSNNLLDDKLDSLMRKEININMKQKYINKLSGKEIFDENYDLTLDNNNNKPLDINKFILLPKKKKDNGGENLDNFFMKRINNNNLFSIKKNKISGDSSLDKNYNDVKSNDISIKSNKIDKFINKDLTKYQKYNLNSVNISKIISLNNSNNKNEKNYNVHNNTFNNEKISLDKNNIYNINNTYNISITDRSDSLNYNLKPNKKIKSARETLKKILLGMNKSNDITSSKDGSELKYFILRVLDSQFFLRKILYICYELAETYNIKKQTSIETINDSEFINKLIEDYEDIGEKNDLRELNNIKKYENGLEEIKQITNEIQKLENEITEFSRKVNVYE
jgi:hypothetical protein